MKTVVVGMSGGVDSSVCAYLLKQQGFNVIGLFMKNWEEDAADGSCQAEKDFEDVARVAEHIGIPYYSVSFSEEYWDSVFADALQVLRAGQTPNPDILCNRYIKFNVFAKKAKDLGADYLATGHYCQLAPDPDRPGQNILLKGADPNKDQSYFLHAVEQQALANVLFPIGHLPKPEVRRIAQEAGLPTAAKKDSTGICFIGKRKFKDFMERFIERAPGDFRKLDGSKIGRHDGLSFYTIGQRKGLGIGGEGEAWFVVGKDVSKNIVYIEQGENHPALFKPELRAHEAVWIGEAPNNFPYRCKAKCRYRQEDQDCDILSLEDGRVHVRFLEPQRAVTPGQSVVFYQGERCLGGAVIQD